MSDTEKPTPESPNAGTSEATASAQSGGSAQVISIEQARAELLRKPRSPGTPPKGVGPAKPRSRGREVPMPVTLPPGEHSSVIVTDTPAARAHFDKRTVHPGEVPAETTAKKVRVKTQFDPRRQKTQVTDRRPTPVPPEVDTAAIWSAQPPSQPPPLTSSQPPPPITGSQRPSLVRPRPMTREGSSSGAPLFLIGVALAAALGAVLVYMLSRQKTEPTAAPSGSTSVAAGIPVPTAPGSDSGAQATTSAPVTEPVNTGAQTPELPSAVPATPVKTGHSTTPRPTPTVTAAPTASAKPTATSILPFGKEEP